MARYRHVLDWSGFLNGPQAGIGDHLLTLTKTCLSDTPIKYVAGRRVSYIRWWYERQHGPLPKNRRLRRNRRCPYPRCLIHWQPASSVRDDAGAYEWVAEQRRAANRLEDAMAECPYPQTLRRTETDLYVYTHQMASEGIPDPTRYEP